MHIPRDQKENDEHWRTHTRQNQTQRPTVSGRRSLLDGPVYDASAHS
jgi:hypothetical protein